MSTTYSLDAGFDHVHLSEVDPSFKILDAGVYLLQLQKAQIKTYLFKPDNKKGIPAGTEGSYLNLTWVVVDDPNFAGRKQFETLFPGEFTFKILKRIADASGIQQQAGQTLADWAEEITREAPKMRRLIKVVPDVNFKTGVPNSYKADGVTPADKNELSPFEILPE